MSRDYTPRRCSKRWLDGDCPTEVLAIMYHPGFDDGYTVFYNDAETIDNGKGHKETWLTVLGISPNGRYYHDEMQAHEVAAYRYRNAHRYVTWSSLPEAVKNTVRADLKAAAEYAAQYEGAEK